MKVIIPILYPTEETETSREETSEVEGVGTGQPGIIHALDPVNINPRNSSGDILSIEIVLEATDQSVIDELVARDYEIRDKLSSYLAFKTASELNDQANWEQYKKDMIELVNNSLTTGQITGLYIPSKIIQFM
ncbi:flagellar basal body-associated FliL family protein [Candidatus Latescibacterota bacterium]